MDLSVYLGNYILANDNRTAYLRQRQAIVDAIKTYGTGHIAGVTVGHKFMFEFVHHLVLALVDVEAFERSYLNGNGTTDPNSSVGNRGADILIADIRDTINTLNSMNLSKHIPVGNSDASAYFNTKVLQSIEYGVGYLVGSFTLAYMIDSVFGNFRWQACSRGLATCRSIMLQGGPMMFSRKRPSHRRHR